MSDPTSEFRVRPNVWITLGVWHKGEDIDVAGTFFVLVPKSFPRQTDLDSLPISKTAEKALLAGVGSGDYDQSQ